MEYLSNDHKDHPNLHKNSHKMCDETGHLKFIGKSLETEATTWLEFPNGGKAIAETIEVSEEINPKEQECEIHSQGSKWES